MEIIKKVVAALVALAIASSGVVAQTTPEEKQVAKMHTKLEKIFNDGERAKLDLVDGRRVQGHVTELRPNTFVLADDGRSSTYWYSEVKKVARFGPSPNARKWVALAFLGGLLGLTFGLAATQTR